MTTRAESFGVKLNKANWTATPVMICDELGVVLSCFIRNVDNRYTHNQYRLFFLRSIAHF